MVQTIQAKDINLAHLSEKFGLERIEDEQFFRDWQDNLPELSDLEKQLVDEVKGEFFHLSQYEILEPVVKMVVLSPLLKLAGFYRPPFYITAEKGIEIVSEDEGTIVRGQIDILVFHPPFWIITIEAKRAQYSLEAAIPQVLAYILGSPDSRKPVFGFLTNGREFQFLKLTKKGVYSHLAPNRTNP
ncbi:MULTISPECIES: type I restriction enzyme HsdR N-terminal domain-containing protein [Brasilonema]|uniref:type I restriction enzyme HsdR N-terminal domain-containing protein n=1 Tax=Brasilonema TaxID=383614 RepID=UPI001B7D0AD3|nr:MULTISPECIES: type I restriction enzyme HsdR N-terminal domain-containing protein [Brasilonema]